MKSKTLYLFLLILFFFESKAQSIARVQNVKIQSEVLGQEREILIYTPVDYDWRSQEYFNVIYDVFSNQKKMKKEHKIIWTIAAIFFNIITAIVYYFVNKK
jgi:hypothetical protein